MIIIISVTAVNNRSKTADMSRITVAYLTADIDISETPRSGCIAIMTDLTDDAADNSLAVAAAATGVSSYGY